MDRSRPTHLVGSNCDSNAECESGTTCVSNVGADYGWHWSVDVCE